MNIRQLMRQNQQEPVTDLLSGVRKKASKMAPVQASNRLRVPLPEQGTQARSRFRHHWYVPDDNLVWVPNSSLSLHPREDQPPPCRSSVRDQILVLSLLSEDTTSVPMPGWGSSLSLLFMFSFH